MLMLCVYMHNVLFELGLGFNSILLKFLNTQLKLIFRVCKISLSFFNVPF